MRYIRSRTFVTEETLLKNDQGEICTNSKVEVLGELVSALIDKVRIRSGYTIPANVATDVIELRTVWRPGRNGWDISATFFAPVKQPDLFSKEINK